MKTRYFALILGIAFILSGIAGFVPGLTTYPEVMTAPTPAPMPGTAPGTAAAAGTDAYPRLLGLFPVNVLHNLFHLVWGIFGVVAYRSFGGARSFARATAVVYGVLTVLGLIPGLNTMFGLIPIFGHDVWFHGLIAIVAAYFGFAAGRDVETATTTATGTAHRV